MSKPRILALLLTLSPTYKADYAPPVAASLKKNGMSKVRAEVHQGKNSLDYGQFALALKWFAAQE